MSDNALKKNMLGVLPVFLIIQTPFIINPLMSALSKVYGAEGISYSMVLMLSTITSLVQVPFAIVAGALAGKHMKFKTISILSCIMALIGGLGPFFFHSYYAVLICRAVLGIGTGMAGPLANALVGRIFSGDRAASMQGIGTTIMNVSGVVFQALSGYLCVKNLNYAWLVNLILVIPIVLMAFFLREPEPDAAPDAAAEEKHAKVKMPAVVWWMSIAWGLLFMVYYPFLLNMSTILVGEGIGTAATAGTVQSLYSIAGMVAGVTFGKLYKSLGKYTLTFCLIIQVVGLVIGYFATNAALMMVASFATGFAIFTIWPAAITLFTKAVPSKGLAMAAGIWSACLGLGGFLSSAYVAIVSSVTGSDAPRMPILVAVFVTAVLAVFWSIGSIRDKSNQN